MSWQLTSLGFDTAKMFDYFFVREKIFRCLFGIQIISVSREGLTMIK